MPIALVCHAVVNMNVNQLVKVAAFPVHVPIHVPPCSLVGMEANENFPAHVIFISGRKRNGRTRRGSLPWHVCRRLSPKKKVTASRVSAPSDVLSLKLCCSRRKFTEANKIRNAQKIHQTLAVTKSLGKKVWLRYKRHFVQSGDDLLSLHSLG